MIEWENMWPRSESDRKIRVQSITSTCGNQIMTQGELDIDCGLSTKEGEVWVYTSRRW